MDDITGMDNGGGMKREITQVNVGGKVYGLGDTRNPGVPDVTINGIGVTYMPTRVVELLWSDGMRDTILPSLNQAITIRHREVQPKLIEIPNLDTSNLGI